MRTGVPNHGMSSMRMKRMFGGGDGRWAQRVGWAVAASSARIARRRRGLGVEKITGNGTTTVSVLAGSGEMFVGQAAQARDDGGVRGGDVVLFAGIGFQVEQGAGAERVAGE